jgi:hypothetical protein
MGSALKRGVQAPGMPCHFALLLDRGPHGPNRSLPVHLTCPACGGHHAVSVTDRLPVDRPWRAAERADIAHAGEQAPALEATHQCRDCGHQWADAALPSSTVT